MNDLILMGPEQHPGANYVIRKDGRRIDLRFVKNREVILNEVEISSTGGYGWPTPIDTTETNSEGNYSFRDIDLKGEEKGNFSVNVLTHVRYVELCPGETDTLNIIIR